ncbi:MAG TPA: hypothetical protein VHE30_25990 [Polyangiaceae bacterium]|nr:hypothetical protein [Polyangiaceae bacterium]
MSQPAAVYVLASVEAVLHGDWALARWAHRKAVAARAVALFDDGEDLVMPEASPGRMVGAERCSP